MLQKCLVSAHHVPYFLVAQNAVADAPLKGKLGLDTDQAKIVYEIQAKHRTLKRARAAESEP